MTTGEPLVVRVAMKPISTLMSPLQTVDLRTGAPAQAQSERSDVTAVPAMGVIAEALVALVLADAMLEKFGGDSLGEMRRNYEGYVAALGRRWEDSGALRRPTRRKRGTMKRHILIIGLPGAGKSTVGRLVAEKLGADFVDPDAVDRAQDADAGDPDLRRARRSEVPGDGAAGGARPRWRARRP